MSEKKLPSKGYEKENQHSNHVQKTKFVGMAVCISLNGGGLQERRGWETNPFALQNCIKGGLSVRQDETRALSAIQMLPL